MDMHNYPLKSMDKLIQRLTESRSRNNNAFVALDFAEPEEIKAMTKRVKSQNSLKVKSNAGERTKKGMVRGFDASSLLHALRMLHAARFTLMKLYVVRSTTPYIVHRIVHTRSTRGSATGPTTKPNTARGISSS